MATNNPCKVPVGKSKNGVTIPLRKKGALIVIRGDVESLGVNHKVHSFVESTGVP